MTNKQTAPADAREALATARRITHDLSAITPAHACAWRAYIGLTDETPNAEQIARAYHAASALHNYATFEYLAITPTIDRYTRDYVIAQCADLRAALDTYTAR
jgi:hypothetical protein